MDGQILYGQIFIYLKLYFNLYIFKSFGVSSSSEMKQNSVPMAQMAGTGSTKVTINDSSKHDDGVCLIWRRVKIFQCI